jgi:WD40 repeat protein
MQPIFSSSSFGTSTNNGINGLERAMQAIGLEDQEESKFDIIGTNQWAHKGGVWRILPIGSGKIATASYDKFARIINADSQEQANSTLLLKAHKKEALSLAYNGEDLITGSSDGQMFFWDCLTGKIKRAIREPIKSATGIYSMVLLGSGRIATGACQKPAKLDAGRSWNHVIKIWDIQSGRVVSQLQGHSGGIPALVAIGNLLVSASGDKSMRVWNSKTYEKISLIEKAHNDYIYSIAAIGENQIISGARDRKIKIWDIETGKITGHLEMDDSGIAHTSTVYDVASFQDSLILSGSRDGYVKVWDRRNDSCIKTLAAEAGFVYSVAGLDDGRIAAGMGTPRDGQKAASGSVSVWEFRV